MTDGGPGPAGPGALRCQCCGFGRILRDGRCGICLGVEFNRERGA